VIPSLNRVIRSPNVFRSVPLDVEVEFVTNFPSEWGHEELPVLGRTTTHSTASSEARRPSILAVATANSPLLDLGRALDSGSGVTEVGSGRQTQSG